MSRTNNTEKPRNPAQKFLRWRQAKKQWEYYDKDAQESRYIPLNTPFIVLDVLSTVTGFNDAKNCGIWSNEVRRPGDLLEVRDKDGLIASGPWKEIKGKVHYAKFAFSVYAFAKINGTPELVNFQLSGCALGPWIDFRNGMEQGDDIFGDLVVAATSTVEGKKGAVTFNSPKFEIVSRTISPESKEIAEEMDRDLQKYLDGYLAASPQAKAAAQHSEEMQAFQPEPVGEPPPPVEDEDDLPF